jgi:PAS domain S-box-containing protein
MSKTVNKKGGLNKPNLATLQLHMENRLATVVAAAPCVICAFKMPSDGVLHFNYCSTRIEELFGVPPRELEIDGSPVLKLIHADDQENVLRTLRESAESLGVWHVEFRVVNPYKGEIWVEGHALARQDLDGAVLWHGYLTEITSRKQSETKFFQKEALSRAVFESTTEGILVVSEEGRVLSANPRFRELWRVPVGLIEDGNDEKLLTHLLEQLLEPQVFLDKAHLIYGTDKESMDSLRFKDGRVYERFSRPLIIEERRVGRLWSFRDVTEQERAAGGLRRTEANLKQAEATLRQTEANLKQTEATLRQTEANLKQAEATLRQNETSLKQTEATLRLKLTEAEAEVALARSARENRQAPGSTLRESEKMEVIGQLAGGLAQDFNNLLTVILGNTELLSKGSDSTPERQELARQIVGAARRASGLTRQLLAFSPRQVKQTQRLDLNELLADVYKRLYRVLGERIALQCNYGPELSAIDADPAMLEQVIMNLVVNAREAMPKGGRLSITTQTELLGRAAAVRNAEAREGRFVVLTLTDTGCGMDTVTLNRLFEPFFTTKGVGKGTGLGLATVYGIVKQHNGWLEVGSKVGQGTTFRIFFPAAAHVAVKRAGELRIRGAGARGAGA